MKKIDKWLYFRCSTDSQDFESQKGIIEKYFYRMGFADNVSKLPRIEDFGVSRDTDIILKNLWRERSNIEDGAYLYCSELSRLGCNLVDVLKFVEYCNKRNITIIDCSMDMTISNDNITGEIFLFLHTLNSKMELLKIRSRSRAGVEKAIQRGSLFGKANPNYGKNISPEQHEENLKRGNILRAKNRNENFVKSDRVSKFCNILMYARPEFEANLDKSRLFYEDFHKVNVRLSGDDYVKIMSLWNNFYQDEEKISISKAQNTFHTIKAALQLYETNKNALVLL